MPVGVRALLGFLPLGWASGTQPTWGSRCRCVITSTPLAGLHYAVRSLRPQQDLEPSMPL